MMQMKVHILCKTLSNCIRIQKSAFKNQKPMMLHLIASEDGRKTIKVTKVLHVKCATVTSIAKVLYISDGCCTEFNIYYFILYLF